MSDLLRDFLVLLAGGAVTWFLKGRLTPKEQAETIQVQGKTLADAFDEIRELRKELHENRKLIAELQETVGRYQRGIERAKKHARRLAPDQEPPDFLQDTGELNKRQ